MGRYVDGYLLAVPKKKLAAYKKIAAIAGQVWMKHGALQYVETAGDDLAVPKGCFAFTDLSNIKKGESVVFSFIVYKSRAHRDQVNAKVFQDKRMLALMEAKCPFDPARMAHGGFKPLVDL